MSFGSGFAGLGKIGRDVFSCEFFQIEVALREFD